MTPPRDSFHDVVEGIRGAAIMAASLLSPFLRDERSRWGLSAEDAARPRVGDDLVPSPRWQWTHAVEIDRAAEDVWPWVAQIGADRGGFYPSRVGGAGRRHPLAASPRAGRSQRARPASRGRR